MSICVITGISGAEPVNGVSVLLHCECFTISPTLNEQFPFQLQIDPGGNVEVQLRNAMAAHYQQFYPGETLVRIITPGFGSINV